MLETRFSSVQEEKCRLEKSVNDLQTIEGSETWLLPPIALRTIYTELVVDNAKPNCVFNLPPSNLARKESEKRLAKNAQDYLAEKERKKSAPKVEKKSIAAFPY